MFTAFAVKSDGFGGHEASVSWAWIAFHRLRAVNDVSLVQDDEVVLLFSVTCLAKSSLERFLGIAKIRLFPYTSSKSIASLNTFSRLLLKRIIIVDDSC